MAVPPTVERFGRPMRHFPVAVSAEAMALAWARENGPSGATVVVDTEIGARGLHGRIWETPQPETLTFSVVLRPALSVEEGNAAWPLTGLAAAEGAEKVVGKEMATWWPDEIIAAGDETRERLGAVRADVQLGPGKVKSVVSTLRFDLPRLGVANDRRDELLEATVLAMDAAMDRLEEGAAAVVAAYEGRCALVGKRVKLKLMPKGETRGTANHIDRSGRLELGSPSGMVEKIGVDQIAKMEIV